VGLLLPQIGSEHLGGAVLVVDFVLEAECICQQRVPETCVQKKAK